MIKFSIFSCGVMVLMVSSLFVMAQQPTDDPCAKVKINTPPDFESCRNCVSTPSAVNGTNCTFETNTSGAVCLTNATVGEVTSVFKNISDCNNLTPTPTPTPPTTTSTTTPIPTTPTTTTATPTTSTVQPTTPTTTASSTTTNGSTTAVPPTTAAPHPAPSGGMSVASFFGGIVFTLCMSGLAYLVWRFYKARMDRNYHTL